MNNPTSKPFLLLSLSLLSLDDGEKPDEGLKRVLLGLAVEARIGREGKGIGGFPTRFLFFPYYLKIFSWGAGWFRHSFYWFGFFHLFLQVSLYASDLAIYACHTCFLEIHSAGLMRVCFAVWSLRQRCQDPRLNYPFLGISASFYIRRMSFVSPNLWK